MTLQRESTRGALPLTSARPREHKKAPPWLWVTACVLISASVSIAAGPFFGSSVTQYGLVATIGATLVFSLLTLPVHLLPMLAFAQYTLGLAHVVSTGLPIGISASIMIFWAFRRAIVAVGISTLKSSQFPRTLEGRKLPMTVPVLAIALMVWMFFLSAFAPLKDESIGWIISFLPVVILPLIFRDLSLEAKAIRNAWVILGAVLGIYASLEVLFQENFLYWALGANPSQHWSVYRAEGAFGHPLLFGAFLAVAAVLAFGEWLDGRRAVFFVAAFCASAGVIATSSRGSLVALFVGVVAAICMVVLRPGRSHKERAVGLILALGTAIALVLMLTPLLDRWFSEEAERSTVARTEGLELAIFLIKSSNYLGTGPGTSSLAARSAGSTLPIELSPLQALVSLGVPGSLLLLCILFVALHRSFRDRNIVAVSGVATFVVAISGFNYFDDRRSALILLGCILIISLGSRMDKDSRVTKGMRHEAFE